MGINATLNFILMFPLKIGGIALASSIAGTVDFLILFYILDKRLGGLDSEMFYYFLKVTLASALTGLLEYWAWEHISEWSEVVKLVVVGVSGFIFYGFVCLGLKIKQAERIWESITRKTIEHKP